jgi:hypothetical protein
MSEVKIYECEVERIKIVDKKRVPFWKVKSVRDAIDDSDTRFRCKDCHGEVKLFRKHVVNGPAPHVEHKVRQDSEYCPSGI